MVLPFWFLVVLIALNLVVLPYFLLTLGSAAGALLAPREGADAPQSTKSVSGRDSAHDEESGITETVQSCLAVDYPKALFEVLVIADNCRDETAAVARRAGATVVERHDQTRKSKGYAISI